MNNVEKKSNLTRSDWASERYGGYDWPGKSYAGPVLRPIVRSHLETIKRILGDMDGYERLTESDRNRLKALVQRELRAIDEIVEYVMPTRE